VFSVLSKALPRYYWLLLCPVFFYLSGCSSAATLLTNFEKPSVELASVRMLQPNGLSQRFRVGLTITNPNGVALKLTGLTYSLSLEDYKLISGASNEIPTLEAYAQTTVELDASTNLLNSVRLIQQWMSKPQESLSYRLEAKLGLINPLLPAVTIDESGEIPMLY